MPSPLPKHSLSAFVETNDQLIIVRTIERSIPISAISSPELRRKLGLSEQDKQQLEKTLLEIVTRWKMNLGLSNKNEEQKTTIELALVRDFIIDNYPMLSIEEIELSYILSLTDKLEDCDYFGYFSPLYVGKVLNAYLHYRKIQLADAIRRQDKAKLLEKEKNNKPTPEQEAKLTIEIFETFYKEHKDGKNISDLFNICWNYLRAQVRSGNRDFLNRWTNPQKLDYEQAIAYATETIIQKESAIENLYKKVQASDRDSDIKKIARNYCVQRYFDEVSIEVIVNLIKPEHFVN